MSETQYHKELVSEYHKLAKKADQRLLRLERYANERKGYSSILQYSYKRAMRDIRSWSGEHSNRFNTKPPSNTNQLKAKISDIKRFLDSTSSTLKGVTSVYEKRANTLNTKYGLDITWDELARFFDSSVNDKLDMKLDSNTKMDTLREMRLHKSDINRLIRNRGNLRREDIELNVDDDVVSFEIENILLDKGISKREIKSILG